MSIDQYKKYQKQEKYKTTTGFFQSSDKKPPVKIGADLILDANNSYVKKSKFAANSALSAVESKGRMLANDQDRQHMPSLKMQE